MSSSLGFACFHAFCILEYQNESNYWWLPGSVLLKKNKMEGSKKDYCEANRTQKKRMLSKLTVVISIEIQKSGTEVLLALSRLWGKEQGVERAFPLRAFTRRPCRRQPCSASTVHRQGWGLWEAAGWDLLWAKPQWSSPGDRAGVPTAQHSASCAFILWYHAMQSCTLVLNSILKNILFLECFESSLALKIRSKKGSRGTKSPHFKYCYFENDS